MRLPKLLTVWVGKVLIALARARGHSGSALPGLVAEKLRPKLLHDLAESFPQGVIVVTGTNGKTTTTKILSTILHDAGLKVLTNRSGSNFTRGILSTFIEKADMFGRLRYDIAVLELDEAYSKALVRVLKPRLTVVLNVLRDQLDRYGEIAKTAELIGHCVAGSDAAVLNKDDPLVAELGSKLNNKDNLHYFGVAKTIKSDLPTDEELHNIQQSSESKQRRPQYNADTELVSYKQQGAHSEGVFSVRGEKRRIRLKLHGVYNGANTAAALEAALSILGPGELDSIVSSIERVEPAFGRGEKLEVEGKTVTLALVKNPAGFNQNVKTMITEAVKRVVICINDNYADGRDVSWLWDVDLAPLKKSGLPVLVGGLRGHDMALRLHYEGIKVKTVELNSSKLLDDVVKKSKKGDEILVLPTYTAMLELRKELGRYTEVEDIW